MKKLIALLLAMTMLFALAACGSQAAPAAETQPAADAEPAAEAPAEAETPAEKIPLKISHHPYLHGLPSTYAEENGLYDGFDYTIDYYSGGPVHQIH